MGDGADMGRVVRFPALVLYVAAPESDIRLQYDDFIKSGEYHMPKDPPKVERNLRQLGNRVEKLLEETSRRADAWARVGGGPTGVVDQFESASFRVV